MAEVSLGPVHHIRLSVNDVERSRAFYTEVLGFQVAKEGPPPPDDPHHQLAVENLQGGIVLMGSAGMLLGLRPTDDERRESKDQFDPFRVGLDHLSFSVQSRDELSAAQSRLDDSGVPHGEVTDLPPWGIAVLPFRDPDGIQLELTSPL
jgi:glyoxylase I family protein